MAFLVIFNLGSLFPGADSENFCDMEILSVFLIVGVNDMKRVCSVGHDGVKIMCVLENLLLCLCDAGRDFIARLESR